MRRLTLGMHALRNLVQTDCCVFMLNLGCIVLQPSENDSLLNLDGLGSGTVVPKSQQ